MTQNGFETVGVLVSSAQTVARTACISSIDANKIHRSMKTTLSSGTVFTTLFPSLDCFALNLNLMSA